MVSEESPTELGLMSRAKSLVAQWRREHSPDQRKSIVMILTRKKRQQTVCNKIGWLESTAAVEHQHPNLTLLILAFSEKDDCMRA